MTISQSFLVFCNLVSFEEKWSPILQNTCQFGFVCCSSPNGIESLDFQAGALPIGLRFSPEEVASGRGSTTVQWPDAQSSGGPVA